MAIVPTKIPQKISWFKTREAAWTTNATGIGITTAEMTTMTARTAAAAAALAAHELAQAAAKDATVALHEATRLMGAFGADLIKKIRAKAGQVGGDGVYALASVPPPATPSARPAPGKPTDLTVELDGNGSLVLKFKCPNPAGAAGTIYQIWRAVGAGTDFAYLGGTGQRKYVDTTVPAGATKLTYQIQAVRSTAVGMWATFVVNFGTNAGGGATASVSEPAAAPKLAA
jgi:hypothetical protein